MKPNDFPRFGAVQKLTYTVVALALMLAAARPVRAGDFTITSATGSTALTGWEATKVYDGNTGTCWSSATHASAAYTEWIAYWWSGAQTTNYVKVLPRYSGNNALCFPTAFTVFYSNGSSWVQVASYTSYPTPHHAGDWIILPLPANYSANGIYISATTLSNDGVGNYAFQLAEAKAGYDAGFNSFRFFNNNAALLGSKNQIAGVSANAFNPSKLVTWNYDERGIVLPANQGPLRDIYSPQIVSYGGSTWRVYFHGWDGNNGIEQVRTTVTYDDFLTFDTHATQIDPGVDIAVGNESIWIDGANWRMAYTCELNTNPIKNKPGYATSTDGVNWTPNAGNASYMMNVTGYANWANADCNGSNVIVKSGSTWHLYFDDLTDGLCQVYHATGTDGVNFAYQGVAASGWRILTDLRPFTYNGSTYYFGVYHFNTQDVSYTCGTNLSSLGTINVLFRNYGAPDMYIVNAGLVFAGNSLKGILYGAGPTSDLMQNQIYARWLQKKIVFQNSYVTWDVNTGFGATSSRLAMTGSSVETGNFKVYDTDGTTLLYTSPLVTMRAGDVWAYSGS